MKRTLLFLLLTLNNLTFSQIKNGIIEFSIIRNNKFESTESEFLNKFESNIRKEFPKTIYSLNFNTKQSCFYLKERLNEMTLDDFLIFSFNGPERILNKINSDSLTVYYNTEKLGIYKIYRIQKNNWKITEETKIINGYLCIKATTQENPNNDFLSIAWFCPKIPVGYGPLGFNGLPGLILEFSNYVNTFYVKSISLNLPNDPKIDNFEGVKILTDEYLIENRKKTRTPAQKKSIELAKQALKK